MTFLKVKQLTLIALLLAVAFGSPAFGQDEAEAQEILEAGQELLQQEKFGEAAKEFQKVVKANKDLGNGWFLLGYSLHMDGQLEEAIKAHKKAAEFDQFAGIATYNLGCAFALLGKKEAAIEKVQEAVDKGFDRLDQIESDKDLYSLHTDVRFAKILANLDGEEEVAEKLDQAQEHLGNQDFAKAAEIYRGIVEANSQNAFATYRLGYSLHGAGQLEEALEMHTKATKFESVAPIATYNIACVHSLNDDKDEAMKHLTKSIKMGFVRLDALENDPDLNNIREDERFISLVAKVKEKLSEKEHMHEKDKEKDHEDGDHDRDDKDKN